MPIGAGILSNLLLAAFPGEVLVYKLQSVLWSLFLVSPGLALLPIQLKGFLASKGKKKKRKNREGELQRAEQEHELHNHTWHLEHARTTHRLTLASPLRWVCLTSPCSLLLLGAGRGGRGMGPCLTAAGKGDKMERGDQGRSVLGCPVSKDKVTSWLQQSAMSNAPFSCSCLQTSVFPAAFEN